ncbi:hypothetical protein B1A99_04175 [Cohnella sp. CIP 111063]|jgi:hypothetical protein|uniref:DUF5360 family protein n=1 Tax=unclassified Cohnella TaxID=2636738 RepID=UPI000B8BD59F|nr:MULTISPECIES: DUF5360 family protein [unclassified Cohnella]OXS61811.1 hypothetical protein B1A99_04175 [Cohnella sp. CIP 111063]PRX74253.1 hypothetical protein B0G52_102280 [Cohnella sp. SGD-V74]
MSRTLKAMMWLTDIGFILYWFVIWMELIPPEYRYKDYDNEILAAWNVSFAPLDLLISATGLMSLRYFRARNPVWRPLCIVSLVLTFCSGLQAIAFWSIRSDFDWMWWAPNLFLLLYPLFFLPALIQASQSGAEGRTP